MAKAKNLVVWEGLDEYKAQLALMPEAAAVQAGRAIEGAANSAYVEIAGGYPVRTGHLRDSLRLGPMVKRGLVVGAVIKNVAVYAVAFDRGMQTRHIVTRLGVTKSIGPMPPNPVFTRSIVKARRALVVTFKDILIRLGATSVTEE